MKFVELLKHKDAILNQSIYYSRAEDAIIIKAIYSIYKNEFGKEYKKGCGTCYKDVFNILLTRYKSGNMNGTTPYQLKTFASGRINKIVSKDGTMVITNANINKRDAAGVLWVERILNENPGLKDKFSKLPEVKSEISIISDEPLRLRTEDAEPIKMESTIPPDVEIEIESKSDFTLGKKRRRKKKGE